MAKRLRAFIVATIYPKIVVGCAVLVGVWLMSEQIQDSARRMSILSDCGPEIAMLSGRAGYVLRPLQLAAGRLDNHELSALS